QRRDPLLVPLGPLAILAGFRIVGTVIGRFRIRGDPAFAVAPHRFGGALGQDVVGRKGDVAAAPRRSHHKGGNRVARGVPPQVFDDLQPLGDRSPEVADSLGQVALVDVVGTDADFYQFVHQLLHYMGAIVDARQNHRLVPQGD